MMRRPLPHMDMLMRRGPSVDIDTFLGNVSSIWQTHRTATADTCASVQFPPHVGMLTRRQASARSRMQALETISNQFCGASEHGARPICRRNVSWVQARTQ